MDFFSSSSSSSHYSSSSSDDILYDMNKEIEMFFQCGLVAMLKLSSIHVKWKKVAGNH
jgi:hypothetical protein